MCVNVLVENCLYENSAKYFSLRSHEKRTRNNSVSLNMPSVRIEFSKGSVYFSGAKLYIKLLHVQIQQLESFEKFRKTINTFFDWDRKHWIIAFLILRTIDLKVLSRSKMLLNFSTEISYKSFFRWFGGFSLFSPFSAHLCSYCSIFFRLFLLLRFFLNQQASLWHASVGIFLLWHISSVAYFCCLALLTLVTCQLLCGLVFGFSAKSFLSSSAFRNL